MVPILGETACPESKPYWGTLIKTLDYPKYLHIPYDINLKIS